jgi:hypothetical protein
MRSLRPPSWVLAVIPSFALAWAQSADARSCTVASDCPVGFECVPADGGGSNCTPSSCQSNSDCGQGFYCYEVECERYACVPQWQAPCDVDSDCGAGFTCSISSRECDCSGTGTNVPEAGTVSVPCAEVPEYLSGDDAGPPPPATLCDAGSNCLCWIDGPGLCQQTQMGPCSQSTGCPMGWTCTMMACQPPNSDLAWQGAGTRLESEALACVGPSVGSSPGSGVANGGTVSTGGSGGSTASNPNSGSVGSTGATSVSGRTANTEAPAPKAGGCEIAMTAGNASPSAILILVASIARGLRRKPRLNANHCRSRHRSM